jgi:HSP20 family protein
MALMRYRRNDPWKMLETLQEEINKLFDFSFGKIPATKEEILSPSVDIWEDKDNIYVEADLPGFEQKDIKVSVKGDSLSISAKKEETKEEKKKNYYRCERFQGSFYRELDLPSSVDTSKIKAQYKNGVLKITLPKVEKEKEKEIEIEVE